MPGKEQIVEEIGDSLLPNLVNKALAANDRAEYLMTLLQTARDHADNPDGTLLPLTQERMACGVDESVFDTVVQRSTRIDQGHYCIPELERIQEQLVGNLQAMLTPIAEAGPTTDEVPIDAAEYQQRLARLTEHTRWLDQNQLISGDSIDRITTAHPQAGGDSVHLLVMHLHRELNRLQRQIASESIDGAQVYGVNDGDRPLIAAFMRGVNRIRQLKFDHPGLDTTVTRTEDRLVIQNDIGTTDAHVLVIHVTTSGVTVTYTDVHIQRLLFFQNMLKHFPIQWEDTRSRRSAKLVENLYHLSVGQFVSTDVTEITDYLEYLGSRLVFLIDWNRARKRLRKLAPKRVCLEVLQWAADNDLGHMAFLKLGGEQLVLDALQLSLRAPLQLSGQLSDLIGAQRAAEYLKFTLETASRGLVAKQSELLVRDRLRAELRHYLETAHQGLFELVSDHAALIVELSTAARDCLLGAANEGFDPDWLSRIARCAKKWEHLADELVTRARNARNASVETRVAAELLCTADDAADDLEEGIFLLTLVDNQGSADPAALPGDSRSALQEMSHQLVHAAQEYVKAVENAQCMHRSSPREEVADFLEAVDRTISLEHQIDDSHRRSKACILTNCNDFKQLHLLSEINDKLESASDAMMRATLVLRDYVLGEVISR